MKNQLIYRVFETPLGEIICKLQSSFSNVEKIEDKEYENGRSSTYRINGYIIDLIEFKIKQPLYTGETVAGSNGWIWRIEKREQSNEKLKLSCMLTNYLDNISFDAATGEHLDALKQRMICGFCILGRRMAK